MKIIPTLLFLLLLLSFLSGCQQKDKAARQPEMTVRVAQAVLLKEQTPKEFSFIAKPFRTSELSFRVGGPISNFEVYAGNYYRKGEVIATIDDRDFLIRKEQTQAVYDQAKAEFERIGALYEKNNISASTYEKAKAEYTSAKTAFQTAANELNDTRLVAPFDGYVGEVFIEKYQEVKATQPIISFIDLDQLKIETYVTQDIALQAEQLQQAELRFDAVADRAYPATILEISKSTTPNNLSYLLTARLPNPDRQLPAGMSGKLYMPSPDSSSRQAIISIPQQALCHRPAEGDYVWIVNPQNHQVAKRKIIPDKLLDNGYLAVKEGLQADELVAVSGLRFLSEGMPVHISQQL